MQTKEKPLILCIAGGTGGHIFPALAVAEALRLEGWEAHWLGSYQGLEEDIIPKSNISLSLMRVTGLRGKGIVSMLLAPFKLMHALWFAYRVMRRLRPQVALAMGGFVSGPGGLAAWLTKTPLVLHEQNAIPGLTNKILSKFATRILAAFPNSFGGKALVQCTGNPVRMSIMNLNKRGQDERQITLHVLVVGGSRGALALNKVLPLAAKKLQAKPIAIWHQTGKGKLEQALVDYQQCALDVGSENLKVEEFIDDMDAAYRWADVVICRSGALTISELACAGLPALLVPFPFAVDDHQTANARYLTDRGAAVLIPQTELNERVLVEKLLAFQGDRSALKKMAEQASIAAKPNATLEIATVCKSFYEGERFAN